MQPQTVRQLNQLNQAFYAEQAVSWQQARQYVWPSWRTFQRQSQLPAGQAIQVADIGCGTGRLATFLAEAYPQMQYLGLDQSVPLLQFARQLAPSRVETEFEQLDIVEALLQDKPLLPQTVDLITVFGVWHHIPGTVWRQRLLERLWQQLRPGGELWLTFWIPQRWGFRVPAEREASEVEAVWQITSTELEPGDAFLGWQESSAVRYVHWLQPEEEAQLREQFGLFLQQEWGETSLGERGNLCWVLHRHV
jgi:tRNA (uracil-5-)-methyltransferase TRM9